MIRFCTLLFFCAFFGTQINAQYKFSLPEHFRTKRNLPLLDFPTSMQVNLTDFGAIPNDGKDDGPALRKALEFCKKITKKGTGAKLVFTKGKYDLFSGKNNVNMNNW